METSPPEWISIVSPKISIAMAEHSICQPGLPSPHGEVHFGSPSLDFFQRAKSARLKYYNLHSIHYLRFCSPGPLKEPSPSSANLESPTDQGANRIK